jgi:hypothetical protein
VLNSVKLRFISIPQKVKTNNTNVGDNSSGFRKERKERKEGREGKERREGRESGIK